MDASAMIGALAIGLVAGAVLGAAHLASLWWSVVLMRDGRPILGFIAQALRFCVLALALAFIARHGGAAPLLAAAFGVLASRALLLKRFERLA
jgi:F1F0 ATPase subunit 2